MTRPESRQPIPPSASVVFAGELFEVVRWPQRMFDGSFATYEKVRRPDTVLVVPVLDARVRMIREEQPGVDGPTFGLIGGRVDPLESPAEAAHRELGEEAGLRAGDVELWLAFQTVPKVDWATYVFVARDCVSITRQELPDPGERIHPFDASFEEFIDLAAEDSFRDAGLALRLLRIARDPRALAETKAFLGLG